MRSIVCPRTLTSRASKLAVRPVPDESGRVQPDGQCRHYSDYRTDQRGCGERERSHCAERPAGEEPEDRGEGFLNHATKTASRHKRALAVHWYSADGRWSHRRGTARPTGKVL